jgi:hypothetical protein
MLFPSTSKILSFLELLPYNVNTGSGKAALHRKGHIMVKNTFCPFINGECRHDCVFNCGHNIGLNNGTMVECELMAFISLQDSEDIERIASEITKLIQKN